MNNTQLKEEEKTEQLELNIEIEEDEVETDSGVEVKKEEEKTSKDQELDSYTDDVKKRINTLTWKMREAERREKAALDYAKKVKEENESLSTKYNKTNEDLQEQYGGKIVSQLAEAKRAYKLAYEEGDADQMAEAQSIIAKLSVEEENVKKKKEELATQKEDVKTVAEQPLEQNKPAQDPDPKAVEWASRNDWFGKNDAMTFTVYSIHRKLTEEEGFDPTSDEYYAEVDKRIRDEFPHKFEDNKTGTTRKNVQTVAPANRNVKNGRNTIRLTKSQVAIAKKLGVPLEEYAKHVKEPT
jgi:hypothetical protein|tara:strand:+ start:20246 stop:21136 length:891 start_codon:yes stop_codon:yes gene_type:complete